MQGLTWMLLASTCSYLRCLVYFDCRCTHAVLSPLRWDEEEALRIREDVCILHSGDLLSRGRKPKGKFLTIHILKSESWNWSETGFSLIIIEDLGVLFRRQINSGNHLVMVLSVLHNSSSSEKLEVGLYVLWCTGSPQPCTVGTSYTTSTLTIKHAMDILFFSILWKPMMRIKTCCALRWMIGL